MRIAEVIGKLTLSKWHPSLDGAAWRIGVPLMQEGLSDPAKGRGEPFVIYDELGSGEGATLAVSESAEASAAFHPEQKPIDAYNAAILDTVDVVSTNHD